MTSYTISGTVDFSTVTDQLRQASIFITAYSKETDRAQQNIDDKGSVDITIDMSEVSICNSAALALVLEIAKDAANKNLKIHFNHLPETLLTIAKAYGAESEFREIIQ